MSWSPVFTRTNKVMLVSNHHSKQYSINHGHSVACNTQKAQVVPHHLNNDFSCETNIEHTIMKLLGHYLMVRILQVMGNLRVSVLYNSLHLY